MRRERLMAGVVLSLTVSASVAHGHVLELLEFACEPNGARRADAIAQAKADCALTAAKKTTCAVVEGSPFNCFSAGVWKGEELCKRQRLAFTLNASTPGLVGWTLKGEVSVDAAYSTTFVGEECRLDILDDPLDEGAGTFVSRSGKAVLTADFTATGEGWVKFLGGKVFGKRFTASCESTVDYEGHRTSKTRGCESGCEGNARLVDGMDAVCAVEPPIDTDWVFVGPASTVEVPEVDVARPATAAEPAVDVAMPATR